ncbi:unnamed protein product [Brachionus calyciflorus]|uniref:Uncharacterized protein n=1 Tax=Brachionus calyciflorus TaxID=104777 RepID=A0A813V6B0_9BILA|nr:unnamed protein product [Brachionus calyciflorus]
MRIFNSESIPVLLYGCESSTLTETSIEKLNCLARTFYRIMRGIKQSETHLKNEEFYKIVKQRPISEELRKRQLKFIGNCMRMVPEEPANIYALYQSKVRERDKIVRPTVQYIDKYLDFYQMIIE